KLIHRNMAPNAPNIAGIWASDAETKSRLQTAPIKDAAPMPKETRPKAAFSATFIDCPRPEIYHLFARMLPRVMEGCQFYWRSLGDSNPCFRRERSHDGYPKLLLAWEKTS